MPSGGTGLLDVVEFAESLGRSSEPGLDPRVAIISGRACIRLQAPYMQGRQTEADGRRLQWFNVDNDAKKPPDRLYALQLPVEFPGTLITMRFTLDASLGEVGSD